MAPPSTMPPSAECQAAESNRLADLQRGQSPVCIQPVAHGGAGDRGKAQIVRKRVRTERGKGNAAVGDLVAGIDGSQPVIEGQDEIRKNRPAEGENQRREGDRMQRRADILQPKMAEFVLHDIDRADQQHHAEYCGQVTQPGFMP